MRYIYIVGSCGRVLCVGCYKACLYCAFFFFDFSARGGSWLPLLGWVRCVASSRARGVEARAVVGVGGGSRSNVWSGDHVT